MPDYLPSLDTDALADWSEVVQHDLRWDGILLGNGASLALWEAVAYPSLYERASGDINDPLTEADEALFAEDASA